MADSDEALLKEFLAEVTTLERDNEVERVLNSFKLNYLEHLNLPFDSKLEDSDVRRQYRKLSLLVHPDKCKHPRAQEAFSALQKAQELLLDKKEKDYLMTRINEAREELCHERKKQLKKEANKKGRPPSADPPLSQADYEKTLEFKDKWKMKVRERLAEDEWRRRKMSLRIHEEEQRLKIDEEETREVNKRKRDHEQKWEETRETRVSSWRDFMKGGSKAKGSGPLRPPKLKTEDPNKSFIQRPVKRG